jgi:hypothetical protein
MTRKSKTPDEASDMAETFRVMRKSSREARARKWESGLKSIRGVQAAGFRVDWLTEYQARINLTLDLYPMRRRWHHLPSGRRGSWAGETALQLVRRLL